LRYYERVGLIEEPTRTPSGYRDDADSVLDRRRSSDRPRRPGSRWARSNVSSPSGRQDGPPCGHVLELMEGRAADLDRRIAELRSLRGELRGLDEHGRSLAPEARSPDLVCRILNPAPAFTGPARRRRERSVAAHRGEGTGR
jgi:MerR family copper efflux transcriptional regulator